MFFFHFENPFLYARLFRCSPSPVAPLLLGLRTCPIVEPFNAVLRA
uniref:Uncharacterized protein n=1 Tax=Myoviridae sp. ctdv95 TaxID=2825143 RepID=A0A8S5QB20_9CAUD|nr:MAG TPA: hypothetical protein [Myoviridae sp. ctdv95]DAS20597.1 MAG TPA: hypothetical protein [Caudoviricetes sp.]DAT17700.1 MAG TPA: hypothetical protein [Caudoviricetes sp.]